jgi:hypothetical protein
MPCWGAGSSRPSITSAVEFPAAGGCTGIGSLTHEYNASAYAVPVPIPGQISTYYGNSGVNTCYTSNRQQLDASLFKEFNVTEGSKFQFRFEVFNVPNLTDFSGPSNTNIDASAYGSITSISNNPRDLQFALKYVF